MNSIIETIRTEDAEEVLQLLRKVGSESDNLTFGSEGLLYTVKEEIKYLESLKGSNESVIYVARVAERIIGICSFHALSGRFLTEVRLQLWF